MKKAVIKTLFCLFLASAFSAAAYAQELVVGGQVVGIQISTEGVMVAGVAPVETAEGSKSPASDAGVHEGDFIVELNGKKVQGAGELIASVGALNGEPVELTVMREDRSLKLTIHPALSSENQWMMGMWLRDGISGIGTVTFYDPGTGQYGALGHSISDAEIISITKGSAGAPGELNGCADIGKVLGSVDKNTSHGIFGRNYVSMGSRVVETGEIRTGVATTLSTINGRQAQEYAVEITRIYNDSTGRHVMLTVTDSELCAQTGGIVQGMSGSPILQNGKLVGAVTHVFVNDPTKSYGVSIQDMLSAAGISEKAA